MPEGDTIFRTARTLHAALAGRAVTRFDSVFSRLTAANARHTIVGRTIERVEARGKHLLIWFAGDVVLRTHMRMHGAWHIHRVGERWRRPRADMRIIIATAEYEAVAFNVPVADLTSGRALENVGPVRLLGPDILTDDFHPAEAAARIRALSHTAIADALLNQTVVAGIGNIFKSESLFAVRVDPFADVQRLTESDIARVVGAAQRLMRASAIHGRTRFSVYGRAGQPCRRCGTPISRRAQGADGRVTYWCPRCQQTAAPDA